MMRVGDRGRTVLEWALLAACYLLAGAAAGAVARPNGPGGGVAGGGGAPDGSLPEAASPEGGGPGAPPGDGPAGAVSVAGLPKIVLNGHEIDLSVPIKPQVLEAARAYLSATITLKAGGETRLLSRAQLGAAVPVARITTEIERALRAETPLRRVLERGGSSHVLPVLVDVHDDVALGRLTAFKIGFDREPVSAKFDFVAGELRPEVEGRRLVLYKALATLQDAFESGAAEVDLPVERVDPGLGAADLAGTDFSVVLGWYETPYARIEKNETRNFNLKLAGSYVDGVIVPAGGTFDFNAAVGERSEVRGFKVAPVIAEGELIDGIGGGTCQIASTTFAASFFSGLDLVRRRPHSRPSSYVLLGLDATVAYPSINLELRNPFDFPIAFRLAVADGKVRAEVRGPRRVYDTTFIRDVYQVQPYGEQVVEMPDWPAGVEVISQRGINGYRLRRHRILCKGTACVRETAGSHYPPTTHVVRRGTNPSVPLEGFPLPEPDPHPPYSADRHMLVTQTADGIKILRRP